MFSKTTQHLALLSSLIKDNIVFNQEELLDPRHKKYASQIVKA